MTLEEATDILSGKRPPQDIQERDVAWAVVAKELIENYQADVRRACPAGFCDGHYYRRAHALLGIGWKR